MYFSLLPNILYDEKPLTYPFSDSEYVVAKNIFKKYKINEDVFSQAVFFRKYKIVDGDTPDSLANKAYGDPHYDWTILLTNEITNRNFGWPLSNADLTRYAESQYDNPYESIAYYETYEIKSGYKMKNELQQNIDAIALEKGLRTDIAFFNKPFTYYNGSGYTTLSGNAVCRPVTVMEDLTNENEKKREIYLLKPGYFRQFVEDFKKQSSYKKGAQTYISSKLKKTG